MEAATSPLSSPPTTPPSSPHAIVAGYTFPRVCCLHPHRVSRRRVGRWGRRCICLLSQRQRQADGWTLQWRDLVATGDGTRRAASGSRSRRATDLAWRRVARTVGRVSGMACGEPMCGGRQWDARSRWTSWWQACGPQSRRSQMPTSSRDPTAVTPTAVGTYGRGSRSRCSCSLRPRSAGAALAAGLRGRQRCGLGCVRLARQPQPGCELCGPPRRGRHARDGQVQRRAAGAHAQPCHAATQSHPCQVRRRHAPAGMQLLSMTMGVKEYFQSEFDNVEAEIISTNKYLFPGTITFDDFLWVFGILRSRVFPKLYEDKPAIIPFADLVNHSPDTTSEGSSWEIKENGLFGREVTLSLRTPVDVIWRTASPDSQSNESVSTDLSNREPKT